MSFLAQSMLWGVLAAGIPIALHFFYRSRYRTVPWAAMHFLLTAVEQTSRKLKFQELLLLLLRVVLLIVLALALARPVGSMAGRGASGDAVDAVLVIDTSFSMGSRAGVAPPGRSDDPYLLALRSFARPDGSLTCFDRARAAAIAVVANLPDHSTVRVITVSDTKTNLGPQAPAHLDQAKIIIEGLTLSSRGSDLLDGLSAAFEYIKTSPSPNKEVYLFTDLHKRGWDEHVNGLTSVMNDLREKASIHVVKCGTPASVNVAITGITPQSNLRPGERGDFAVLVRNTSKEPARNLTVALVIDGQVEGQETRPLSEVLPGETKAVLLSGMIGKAGRRTLTATVKTDDLDADNRFDQVISVQDRAGILLVDGAPDTRDPRRSAGFFLHHAINPLADDALPVTVVPAGRALPKDLAGKDLCLLVDVSLKASGKEEGSVLASDFIRALPAFVQQGHGVMIFAGERVEPEAYNDLLYLQARLLPYPISRVENAARDKPWTLDRQSAEKEPFSRFRQEVGYASIDRIEVRKSLVLNEKDLEHPVGGEEVSVLLRNKGGLPAVAARKRPGQGEVLFFTTSVSDPHWSDWFISPAFVPFVQVTLNHLLDSRPGAFNRVAGEVLAWQPPRADAERSFDLVMPGGERERLGYPVSEEGRLVLRGPATTHAGIYRILPTDGISDEKEIDGIPFAVTPNLAESEDLEATTPERLNERFGFSIVHLTAGDDGAVFSGAERLKREWTVWLLGVLLVMVVGEMMLAWKCGRAW